MMSSTPLCAATDSPRRDLRLRGIPAYLADALNRLESSVATSENSDSNSPVPNVTFTTRIYSLTTRLLEFVNSAQLTKEENVALRKNIQELKQKFEEKEDGHLREMTRLKIVLEETNTERQNLRNDLGISTAAVETLRECTVELEKDKLSLQRRTQSLGDQCQNLMSNLQKVLVEKKEIKENRDVMEVELASERNRNNHLAGELQEALQQIERSKCHQSEAAGFTLPQECLSCAKRRSLEEQLKQKIQCLETELEVSKKEAVESEKKLQALAEELRICVVEEKTRAQKLARKNSQLAAERVNAAQQLNAFEEVLNKAHSATFMEQPGDGQANEAMLQTDEPSNREVVLLRRFGLLRESDGSFTTIASQHGELCNECATM